MKSRGSPKIHRIYRRGLSRLERSAIGFNLA
jgi:hypothetical protein